MTLLAKPPHVQIRRLRAVDEAAIAALAEVLVDCVDGDASVSFMHPLSREHACDFFRRVGAGVAAGERALLIAEDDAGCCGTVQLILAQPDTIANSGDGRTQPRP